MNCALEFHDSTIASVTADGDSLTVHFDPAYIHQSIGIPGESPGNGFLQSVEMVFSNATWTVPPPELNQWISDGSLTIDGKRFSNGIPIPFSAAGAVTAEFVLASGEALVVSAAAVRCDVRGEATWIESFPG